MGCCYEYQMHSGGVDHYELHELHDDNLEALVSSNDCPVAERMGGATRFVEGSCTDFEGFASDHELPPCECEGYQSGSVVGDEFCSFQRGRNCALKSNNPAWEDGCPSNAVHCVAVEIPADTTTTTLAGT